MSTIHLRLIEVISVIEKPKAIAPNYYFSKKFLIFKEGVRYFNGMPFSRLVSPDELSEKKIYLEDKEVYIKPYLEISLKSGRKFIKHYESTNEMEKASIEIRKARTEWYTL